ncbi:MAG TPA: hypothetical protein VLX92_17560 [Kofleriaceae bacterium]|nr:hypothetical protein [Kofleriaceae bacterium]
MARALALAIALLLGAPAVHAQPPGLTPQQQQVQRRERIKKRIRALRAAELTVDLSLDETSAGRLFPLLARYDDEFDRLLGQRAEILKKLDVAGPDRRETDRLIDEAIANQHAFWETEDRRLADVRKILSPAQTARLLVVLPPLEQKIRNQLLRAIQGAPAGKARPGGNPAMRDLEDDDDDDAPRPKR